MLCSSGLRVPDRDWLATVRSTVAVFGHRNWIVVADAAYPVHQAQGIQTILASGDPVEVLRSVLDCLADAPHVTGRVCLDAELDALTEEAAPGVSVFRKRLAALLQGSEIVSMPHSDMLETLDEAGQRYRVLVVKTSLCIPYTSVFLPLSCAYWTDEAEAELRTSMLALS